MTKGRRLGRVLWIILIACMPFAAFYADDEKAAADEMANIEHRIHSLTPDPRYRDDPFILVTLQEAIAAKREGSGGVGACLVRESSGEIVARGHNRQYSPYFRSDMHAEMDLLDRFEDARRAPKGDNPRQLDGLVLYSSVEPCPMCLTRIINTGLRKTYYAASDPTGGMVHKMSDLPLYWRDAAAGRTYAKADCSPAMEEIAARLFRSGRRGSQ
jgi:tRNA(adenine34) deaminase